MKFSELELIEPLLNAVKEMKYDIPSPIQEQAIPAIISGRDIFGCAKTGTGKQQLLLYRFYKNYIYVMKAKVSTNY